MFIVVHHSWAGQLAAAALNAYSCVQLCTAVVHSRMRPHHGPHMACALHMQVIFNALLLQYVERSNRITIYVYTSTAVVQLYSCISKSNEFE